MTRPEIGERRLPRGKRNTHDNTICLAPPLVIERAQIDWALERLTPVLSGMN